MTLKGEVGKIEDTEDDIRVTLINVGQKGAAKWKGHGPDIQISMSHARAKNFPIRRVVEISVIGK